MGPNKKIPAVNNSYYFYSEDREIFIANLCYRFFRGTRASRARTIVDIVIARRCVCVSKHQLGITYDACKFIEAFAS